MIRDGLWLLFFAVVGAIGWLLWKIMLWSTIILMKLSFWLYDHLELWIKQAWRKYKQHKLEAVS
jgi:hypothetical protein